MAIFNPRDVDPFYERERPETPYLNALEDSFYQSIIAQAVAEYTNRVATLATQQTATETEDDDDDAALERLGINIRPRPAEEPREEVLTINGNTTANVTLADVSNWMLDTATVQDALNVRGSFNYNGEELETLIRRIVREELQNRREEQNNG